MKNIICVLVLLHLVALGSSVMAADADLAAAFLSQQSSPPQGDSKAIGKAVDMTWKESDGEIP
jgi:hypothetical protein